MRVLVQGWTRYPHSYSIVNCYQTVALSKIPGVELLLEELPPYVPGWSDAESDDASFLAPGESEALRRIPLYDGTQEFDAVYRIAFPIDPRPHPSGKPTFVFYTSEFRRLNPENFGGRSDVAKFRRLCARGRCVAVTPSLWSAEPMKPHALVVPHGVDCSKFYPDAAGGSRARERCGISEGAVVFLAVGAMTQNKNVWGSMIAFYLLRVSRPDVDCKLVLKGNSGFYACVKNIEAYASSMKDVPFVDLVKWDELVRPNIAFVDGNFGYDELRELYCASDYYLAPYRGEGFNMPALEALACGVPLVLPEGGPTAEFVPREAALCPDTKLEPNPEKMGGGTCLSVSTGSLAKVLSQACELRDVMKSRAASIGPKHVAEKYSWDVAAKSLARAIESKTNA